MARTAKKRALPPRRWRMKRAARLASARAWLTTHEGKHIVRSYARWFRVDHLCAAKELGLLGVPVEPAYLVRLHRTLEARVIANTESRARGLAAAEELERELEGDLDADEHFAFIAGTTSGGAHYGVPHERELDIHPDGVGSSHACGNG